MLVSQSSLANYGFSITDWFQFSLQLGSYNEYCAWHFFFFWHVHWNPCALFFCIYCSFLLVPKNWLHKHVIIQDAFFFELSFYHISSWFLVQGHAFEGSDHFCARSNESNMMFLESSNTYLIVLIRSIFTAVTVINLSTPNDYSGRTAPLTSKCCILYIYSTNIGTEYFKHGIYSPVFRLQNAVCFINITYLVPVLFTFYIQVC